MQRDILQKHTKQAFTPSMTYNMHKDMLETTQI